MSEPLVIVGVLLLVFGFFIGIKNKLGFYPDLIIVGSKIKIN